MSADYNTIIQMQNNTNQVYYENSRKNLGSSRMDREGFIRLIMAQLQYQDPTNPQGSTEMLTQQLALEQADQMKSLVDSSKFAQASSMLGKEAQLIDARWDFSTNSTGPAEWDVQTNSAKTVNGEITGVQFDKARGKALVLINGHYYDAENIRHLYDNSTTTTTGG